MVISKAAKIVNIVVFCVWIFLISLVLYRDYTGTSFKGGEALKGSIDKATYWYDLYAGPNKVGFGSYMFEWVGDEVIIKYEQEVKIKQGDNEKLFIESYRCLSNATYAIKSFEYSSHYKNEKGIKVTGEVDSDAAVFFLESPEKRKTFKISTKGRDVYLTTTFIPAIIQKRPPPQSVFTIPMLDMVNLSIDDVRVVVEEIRPVKVGIHVSSYYKMRVGSQVFWSNAIGIIVKEENPSGAIFYLETETIAKDPADRVLFDYTALPFLKSNKFIQNTEDLKTLKVRIGGFPLSPNLYKESTVTIKDNVLTVQKEKTEETKKRSYSLPCDDASLRRYLTADEWNMSENKTIKGNALNMANIEENDAFRFARYLNSNLYFTVTPMPLFTLLNALEAFHARFGDYLERTVLFASFGRAAGLPIRLVGGLVYRDGYFYFHTWPEVWFGKWIPMEPTLAQFPADVTHIPLREGTLKEITSMVKELQSLTIEILEAS